MTTPQPPFGTPDYDENSPSGSVPQDPGASPAQRPDTPSSPSLTDTARGWHPVRRHRGRTASALAAVAILAGATGGAIVYTTGTTSATAGHPTAAASAARGLTTSATTGSSTARAESVSAIAAADSPSVVEVTETLPNGVGIGSGVILTSNGEILTNNHVISDAAAGNGSLTVTFSNGKTASASVIGTDASSDLAVIKASNVSGLKAATLGDSSSVKIGDQVVAIGAPEGLQGTVTTGIVSYLNRKVTVGSSSQSPNSGQNSDPFGNSTGSNPFGNSTGSDPYGNSGGSSSQNQSPTGSVTYNAIQTDASINPGNSGGPLINSSGQVIGIDSAIYSPATSSSTAGSVGLGFAIPINQAKQIITHILATSSAH